MRKQLAGSNVLGRLYGDGKPYIFVRQAVVIAASADGLGELLESLIGKSPPPNNLPPVPPLNEWLPMYVSHRRVLDAVATTAGLSGGVKASDLASMWIQFVHADEPMRKRISGLFARSKKLAHAVTQTMKLLVGVPFPPDEDTVREILKQTDSEVASDEFDTRFEGFMSSAEGQFYFRVWLPCWFIYHEYPPQLLRKARRGCLDSLEKLVRLDKSASQEPRIAALLHELTRNQDNKVRERFVRALGGAPKGRLDKARIKTLLAGLISQLAMALRCPVTAKDIERLFNTVYRVQTGQSREDDPDISNGLELDRAVRNNRIWPSFPRK